MSHSPEHFERIAREIAGFQLLRHAFIHLVMTGRNGMDVLAIRSALQKEMTHDAFMIVMTLQDYWEVKYGD